MPDRGPLDQVPAIHYFLVIICTQWLPQSVVLHAVQPCSKLWAGVSSTIQTW